MSAVGLLDRANHFLRDHARIVEGPGNSQSLQLVWEDAPPGPFAEAVETIRSALPPPGELVESSPQPTLMLLLAARRAGQPPRGTTGGTRYRAVWKLTDAELRIVTEWLDRFDEALATRPGSAFVHRHVLYQWLPASRGDHPELDHPMLFGVVLSRARHIQVPFQLYDADHYWRLKRYLKAIGLATLIDKCVLPKGSLLSRDAGDAK